MSDKKTKNEEEYEESQDEMIARLNNFQRWLTATLALREMATLKPEDYASTDVGAVARKLAVSHSYLCKAFKAEFFISPLMVLQRRRIQLACHLLLTEPEISVKEVSKRLHYSSEGYFIKRFKETRNVTPLQYRKSKLREMEEGLPCGKWLDLKDPVLAKLWRYRKAKPRKKFIFTENHGN